MLLSLLWIASALFIILLTFLLIRAFDARRMPELMKWQRHPLKSEFRSADLRDNTTLADYQAIEDKLAQELKDLFIPNDDQGWRFRSSRYLDRGVCNPSAFPKNWNWSFELTPPEIKGGVLLLHGLTDSPYSMRTIAEDFAAQGFYVLGLRLPGHGTVPAGLLSVSWKDWTAAVKLGVKHVQEKVAGQGPFFMGGYSNGGALTVNYALQAILDGSLPCPDRIILFSPAIEITSFARIARLHRILSWIPYFEKNDWLDIQPEYDPYKYNSFPQNAAAQTWLVTLSLRKNLLLVSKKGVLDKLPPILSFQSIVDATIKGRALVTELYGNLPENGSEIVVFDVNNADRLEGLFVHDFRKKLVDWEKMGDLPYALTIVTNDTAHSRQVCARSKVANSIEVRTRPLELKWPDQVYSLAHVAIPFPVDDPIYGSTSPDSDSPSLRIGDLALRGEKGVLTIPSSQLMRLRNNPFHSFMLQKIHDWIGQAE